MKLRKQSAGPRRPRGGARAARARPAARPHGRQARRPGVPLRRRLAGRLPSIRRALAVLGAVATGAALVALLNGPWLRVSQVAWAGEHFTKPSELERILDPQRGVSILAVDTRSLTERLERLPAVAAATVTASITGRVEAAIVEREAAFVWRTSSAQFLGADDGTIFAAMPLDADLEPELAALPRISDERFVARVVTVGDRIPAALLRTATRLFEIDPAALGSAASDLAVRLDDEFGFRIVSAEPAWEIALGVYGLDPRESATEATARLERQVTAVRTLFATRPETEIAWVDVRNPGKVYFRAKG